MSKHSEPRQLPLLPPEWDAEKLDALGAMPNGLKFVLNGWEETGEAVRGTNMLGTMANHPALAKAFLGYNDQVVSNSSIEFRDREVIVLRVGWLTKSEYEFHMHNLLARRAGLSEEEVEGVLEGPNTTALKAEDQLLVKATDELVLDKSLTDETWNKLSERFSQQQIMDLIFLVGCYVGLAMYINSFNIKVEDSEPPLDAELKQRLYAPKP